jgi:LIM domain
MCRSCFSQNGGSRGICVECSRPVLILKSEGGFVENAGRVWHKKCFHCSGCGKSIGDNPMVDLLGRPSCAECFDTCLHRRDSPGKSRTSVSKESVGPLGGFKPASTPSPGKPRKGSSTIEELEQVLGIRRPQSAPDPNLDQAASPSDIAPISLPPNDHSTSPAPNLSKAVPASSSLSQSSSPSRPSTIAAMGAMVTPGAMEAAKKKFLKQTGSPTDKSSQVTSTRGGRLGDDTLETPTKSIMRYSDFRLLRHKDSTSSIQTDRDSMLSLSSAASIPSLASDHSDTATISSGPSSPPLSQSGEQEDLVGLSSLSLSSSHSERSIKPVSSNSRSPDLSRGTRHSNTHAHTPLSDAKCAKCSLPLFDVKHGGRYVSVPEPSSTGSSPRMYHADCFRCRICNGLFEGKEAGRAVFVRGVRGACHLSVSCHFISRKQR